MFEGKNADGKIIIPEIIIRPEERPAFPYMAVGDENGGKIVPISGTMQFCVFEEFNQDVVSFVTSAEIRLYGGNNELMEYWKFNDVKMPPPMHEPDSDYGFEYIPWSFSYESSSYCCPISMKEILSNDQDIIEEKA